MSNRAKTPEKPRPKDGDDSDGATEKSEDEIIRDWLLAMIDVAMESPKNKKIMEEMRRRVEKNTTTFSS